MADSHYDHAKLDEFSTSTDITVATHSKDSLKKPEKVTLPSSAELKQLVLTDRIADVSTAGQIYVVSPHAGNISAIYSALNGAIITADAVLTAKIATVAVTGGAITITQSGSAAGDVDSVTPTAARTVTAGQAIEIETNGASGNAVSVGITIVIDRV